MKRSVPLIAAFVILLGTTPYALAQHSHGGMGGGTMKMDTKEVLVEGTKVTFQIMPNDEHSKMLKDMKMKVDIEPGTTHNITVMLKDDKTQKDVTDATINMKVVSPNGKDQLKPLKYEADMKSYDGYFDLKEKGKYQVMILFKAGDKKSTAGIYYEVK
jgi:hypothetical protein